jgi:hypothetical protein
MWTDAQQKLALVALSAISARGCSIGDCADDARPCAACIASKALMAIIAIDKAAILPPIPLKPLPGWTAEEPVSQEG